MPHAFPDEEILFSESFSFWLLLNIEGVSQKKVTKEVPKSLVTSIFISRLLRRFSNSVTTAHTIQHPLSREHFSLKIDVYDQTIWNCILEL